MEPLGLAKVPDTNASVGMVRLNRTAYVLLPIFFLLYWSTSSVVLWWAYDVSPLIRGGYYNHHQALALVVKMGLVVTVLTSLIWLSMMRRRASRSSRRTAWTAVWQTALVLIAYAVLILARLQFSDTPAPDSAFLPVLGSINSHFFSEAGWLVFLLDVVPIMGCVSGVLYLLRYRILDRFSRWA